MFFHPCLFFEAIEQARSYPLKDSRRANQARMRTRG